MFMDVPKLPQTFPKLSQSSPRPSQSYSRASRNSPRSPQCLQTPLEPILGGSELSSAMSAQQKQDFGHSPHCLPQPVPHAPGVRMT